jgi:hypothetical protein
MPNVIKIKRSAVPGKVPLTTDLELGELGLNTYDGKLYTKVDDGSARIKNLTGLSFTANSETLSANKTLTSDSEYFQTLNPNGAERQITLHSEWVGQIINDSDGTYALVLKDGATTIVSLDNATGVKGALVWYDGTDYNVQQTVGYDTAESEGTTKVVHSRIRQTLSADKSLTLDSEYFQFLDPNGANRVITLPSCGPTDYYETEIMNLSDGTYSLQIEESDTTPVIDLDTTSTARSVVIVWSGQEFIVWETAYYA